MGVVSLVNIKILNSTNTFTTLTFFFSFGSIATYVLFFYIMNLFPFFSEIFHLFPQVFFDPLCYIGLFFVVCAVILVDNGLNLAQFEIKLSF
jgi:hypothetical protein